jgi:hypothetical protein
VAHSSRSARGATIPAILLLAESSRCSLSTAQ